MNADHDLLPAPREASATLPYLLLALRIAVAWWALLTAVTALFSGAAAFLAALLLYPGLALLIGASAARLQWQAAKALTPAPDPLAPGHRQTLSLELPAAAALRLARHAIDLSFGRPEVHEAGLSLSARIQPHGRTGRWADRLHADLLTISASDDGPAHSRLTVACQPVHRWWYSLLWVDRGRSAGIAQTLLRSIQARVQAQRSFADTTARRDALQTRLAQAELLLLRAQVEPHFLFNTLAHVRACLADDVAAARSLLDKLVEFLRSSSSLMAQANTPLAAELAQVENYLQLIQLRLGQRLHYRIDCDPALGAVPVPTAGVLILVENAVKHGIERLDRPGSITVQCSRAGGQLRLAVHNDGPALAAAPMAAEQPGMGLANLRERLQLSHGPVARLQIEDAEEGGVLATLYIPFATEFATDLAAAASTDPDDAAPRA